MQALADALKDKLNLKFVTFSKNDIGVEGRSGKTWWGAGTFGPGAAVVVGV